MPRFEPFLHRLIFPAFLMYQVQTFENAPSDTLEGKIYQNNMRGTRSTVFDILILSQKAVHIQLRYALPFEEIASALLDSGNSKVALYSRDSQVKHSLGISCQTSVAWKSSSPVFESFALPKNSPYTELFRFQVNF